jgi:two-component system phosphate regulon sensor histidine kinase PhoR
MTDAANQLMEAILEGMLEGIIAIDKDTEVTLYNRAAARIFGLPLTSSGLPPLRLIELTRDPDINEAFRRVLKSREPEVRRVEVRRRDVRVFELHLNPIGARSLDAPGNGAAGVFFDITELERLERVRRDFFGNLSHELRTPLTAILAYIETLLDGAIEDPENRLRFLAIIQKHAIRMQALARDITDLSMIESGEIALRVEVHDLHQVVDEVFTLASVRAEQMNVSLRNRVARSFKVCADRYRLEQILGNLVDNAVKFNSRGGVVEVSAERVAGGGSAIRVTDTGTGIPHADLARVFERFYRADRSRSREVGGSGLGLAIVKHLALVHGGSATVESDHGHGSTFTITRPVCADAPPNGRVSPM